MYPCSILYLLTIVPLRKRLATQRNPYPTHLLSKGRSERERERPNHCCCVVTVNMKARRCTWGVVMKKPSVETRVSCESSRSTWSYACR